MPSSYAPKGPGAALTVDERLLDAVSCAPESDGEGGIEIHLDEDGQFICWDSARAEAFSWQPIDESTFPQCLPQGS